MPAANLLQSRMRFAWQRPSPRSAPNFVPSTRKDVRAPQPLDVVNARMLSHLGFAALASTSMGYAWTTCRPDYAVTREDVLGHLASLSASVDIPVNADFESGFAAEPEGVAASVVLAIETGVAGLSIEDWSSTGRTISSSFPTRWNASSPPGGHRPIGRRCGFGRPTEGLLSAPPPSARRSTSW